MGFLITHIFNQNSLKDNAKLSFWFASFLMVHYRGYLSSDKLQIRSRDVGLVSLVLLVCEERNLLSTINLGVNNYVLLVLPLHKQMLLSTSFVVWLRRTNKQTMGHLFRCSFRFNNSLSSNSSTFSSFLSFNPLELSTTVVRSEPLRSAQGSRHDLRNRSQINSP